MFMLVLLSMWIFNIVMVFMLLFIVMVIIILMDLFKLVIVLLLGIVYVVSFGGVGMFIGILLNIIFMSVY